MEFSIPVFLIIYTCALLFFVVLLVNKVKKLTKILLSTRQDLAFNRSLVNELNDKYCSVLNHAEKKEAEVLKLVELVRVLRSSERRLKALVKQLNPKQVILNGTNKPNKQRTN